ncbi:MAG: hypothetical protein E6Q83_00295 [Thiothrix sp.]|nr:MAG: hypothetical protein E6Q83_00295 [Thiothrix sp.]
MKILFHHPLPLNPNAVSASGIRPLKMLEAFQELGCEVDIIAGYSSERKKQIAKVKENINNGLHYDFMYAESSSAPTTLTDPHHLPLNPLLDYLFFRFCKKNGIPIGLFYRDIYWLFASYGEHLNPLKIMAAKGAYYFDLLVYQQTLKWLYLPSLKMGEYIPNINPLMFKALPPGHIMPKLNIQRSVQRKNRPLKLFYVGGISSYYQLHKLFTAVQKQPEIELTICTRQAEWHTVMHEYPLTSSNIKIIHLSGLAMQEELLQCDIAVLFVKPQEYRDFAVPLKLYEYLGYQKPILASKATLAGDFVEQHGIGWSIPYDCDEVTQFFSELLTNPNLMESIHLNIQKTAPQHSWRARAEQVIQDLTQ